MSSIGIVLELTVNLDSEVEQLDVMTTFFYGNLEEEIYIEQPKGFKFKGKEDLVHAEKEFIWA